MTNRAKVFVLIPLKIFTFPRLSNINFPLWGPLAQLVEQLTLNQRVAGSSPARLTIISMTYGRSNSLPFFICDKLVTSFLPIL